MSMTKQAMTLVAAKSFVAKLGFNLSHQNGEYRLAPKAGTAMEREAAAYYTNDIADAVGTATRWRLSAG